MSGFKLLRNEDLIISPFNHKKLRVSPVPEWVSWIQEHKCASYLRLIPEYLKHTRLIDEWLLAPAAHHDGKVLEELLFNHSDLWLIGDKAYNDAEKESHFWQKRRILLLPLRKDNHHTPWSDDVRKTLGRVRHRVETVFSVLTTAFNIGSLGLCVESSGYGGVVRIDWRIRLAFLLTKPIDRVIITFSNSNF